ncbi:hypothetical protein SAY87_027380 [Trapa incisa]|uniref:GDSL esterase/lipase n=1 Tax=Trapa incisa TaxID=236973 RepID=A0AAN7JEU2_9MYRT|nr:hypothetical protein SAY87_027380 [Trapa incisa]
MGPQISVLISSFPCLLPLLLSLIARNHVEASYMDRRVFAFQPTKMFVFGDSYADTGNTWKNESTAWKVPYGFTYPGKPSGRWSSGHILTDYLALSFGLKSPIPYQWRQAGAKYLKYGMNFAHGGTGVTETLVAYPNMTAQIGLFEQLIKDSTFSSGGLNTSVTLVTLSGNDYSAYLARDRSFAGLPAFITSVVMQLKTNLRRIYDIGARKVAVGELQPLGCLPSNTAANSFQQCNGTVNLLVGLHNQLLRQAVADLNNQTSSSTFVILDLYDSFMSVLNGTGDSKFETPLTPCCSGVNSGFYCGSVDGNGTKMYTLCKDPESRLFWDSNHPTQAGWRAVFSGLSAA